jgi:hypothetical protein
VQVNVGGPPLFPQVVGLKIVLGRRGEVQIYFLKVRYLKEVVRNV